MNRRQAAALLFWQHARARWNAANLRGRFSILYVWPPFPREDEFHRARIELYAATINQRRNVT